MRKIVTVFIIIAVIAVMGLSGFYFLYMYPRYTVPILMYHFINEDRNNSLSISPELFESQMEFLHKNGYSVIPLARLAEGIKSGRKFSHKTVALTFDDGYKCNYLNVFPVLAKYNMPATIFLITDSVGRDSGVMTWDQARLMAKNGIDFGGHTKKHVYLPDVKDDQALREEVEGSKKAIERELGVKAGYFAYPLGGFNDKIKEIVKQAGYEGACTTNRGGDRFNLDVYELNRLKVIDKPFHFRAFLSGYYNLFREPKKRS
ncbi:MAG: polysaccharide deacetylase family protein [Candidatus Omnitrophota bacterium]